MSNNNNIVSGKESFDYKKYLDLLRDAEYTELYNYYSKETMLGILGVARQENPHSCFLRWLLDMNGKHGYGSMPMRKFLESVCLFRDKVYYGETNKESKEYREYADDKLWQQDDNLLGKKNIDILEEIKYGRYEIINQSIANEVVLNNQRRADVFAIIQLKFQRPIDKGITESDAGSGDKNNICNLILLIENKVRSTEGYVKKADYMKWQTEQYTEDLSSADTIKNIIVEHMPVKWMQDQIDDISGNSLKLYVFLNAFQTSVIKEAWKKQVEPPNGEQEKTDCFAKSKEFITINYQYLLDGMIEPLRRLSSDDIVKHRMHDYIRCLGQSKITSIGEQTTQKDDGEYLIMAVSEREKKIAISLWQKYYKVIYPIMESLFFDESGEFLLNENDRDFWTSLSNLYRVIELKDSTSNIEINANDLDDECRKLKELVENANKASRKHKFVFNTKEYESYTSRPIGLLCRDIIADFVKKLENKNVENVRDKIVKLRKEVQGWNLNWLREVILFDEEVEAIQNDSYIPDMEKSQYRTKNITEFSECFFSYMDVLRKKERKAEPEPYSKDYNEENLKQKYLDYQELEIKLESGDKVYVAKFWGSDDLDRLVKHIDDYEESKEYGFNYQSAVMQEY